jgi:hypothetical protein
MFGEGFEQSTILRTGPDGLTRLITRRSSGERESVFVEAGEAELLVFRWSEEFHREALGVQALVGNLLRAADEREVALLRARCLRLLGVRRRKR